MNAAEFRKWLAARGCAFETHRGGSGHVRVLLGEKRSILPMHGGRKELGTGLVEKIKKDLWLK
jgi:mRNA interferase HicA